MFGNNKKVDAMWKLYTELRQEQAANLPAAVQAKFDLPAEVVTPDYVLQLAVTAYMLVMTMPTMLLSIVPVVIVARQMMSHRPDDFNLDKLVELMQGGFQFSPVMQASVTRPVLELAVQLALADWLEEGEGSDSEQLEADSHLYLQMAQDILDVKPDREALLKEAETLIPTMPDDVLADLPKRTQKALKDLRQHFAGQSAQPPSDNQ